MRSYSAHRAVADILRKELFLNSVTRRFWWQVKEITHNDLCDILPKLDRELVKGALSGEKFSEYFFANCKCDKIAAVVKEILA